MGMAESAEQIEQQATTCEQQATAGKAAAREYPIGLGRVLFRLL
jgi:hypothetical protein